MKVERFTDLDWRTECVSNAVRIVVGLRSSKVILARLSPKQLPENETFANARLMTASRELLRVAQEAHRIHVCSCSPRDKERCLRCEAEAAIEKALVEPENKP